jgi:hypothetical protein
MRFLPEKYLKSIFRKSRAKMYILLGKVEKDSVIIEINVYKVAKIK